MAQKNTAVIELNVVLFSIESKSFTLRDQQIYQAVLNEVFKLKKIQPHTAGALEDFLTSRLSHKEAKLFDLSFEAAKITDPQRKKLNGFSRQEVDAEIEVISQALAMLQLKEAQLKEPVRFKAWLDLLKRKYQLRMKSNLQTTSP